MSKEIDKTEQNKIIKEVSSIIKSRTIKSIINFDKPIYFAINKN